MSSGRRQKNTFTFSIRKGTDFALFYKIIQSKFSALFASFSIKLTKIHTKFESATFHFEYGFVQRTISFEIANTAHIFSVNVCYQYSKCYES